MSEFENKVALITGASSGISFATAEILGKNGAKVVIADLNEPRMKEAVAKLKDEGITALGVKTDIGNSASVQNAIDTAVNEFGGLDYGANCAGRPGVFKPLNELSDEEFSQTIDTTLKDEFYLLRAETNEFLKNGHGAIVNISGLGCTIATPTMSSLAAAGTGIEGLTRGAAIDYADKGIRVNWVSPAATYTNMTKKSFDNDALGKQLINLVPMKRYAQPSEIANVIVFLLSSKASFISGQVIQVDGDSSTGSNAR